MDKSKVMVVVHPDGTELLVIKMAGHRIEVDYKIIEDSVKEARKELLGRKMKGVKCDEK